MFNLFYKNAIAAYLREGHMPNTITHRVNVLDRYFKVGPLLT
jgi:hypothetical protein